MSSFLFDVMAFGAQNVAILRGINVSTSQNQNIQSIWCNARSDKTTFYKKFGMLETDKTFNKGGIDYVIMEKLLS